MKRIILLAAALGAVAFVPVTAQAAPDLATCTEHVTVPFIDWGAPGSGDDQVKGTGFLTCTGGVTYIDVSARLIKGGVLQPTGYQHCDYDDYCQKQVAANLSGNLGYCWKTRAWGYYPPNSTPTGATTSTSFCFP